jgi:hypothetical protein
MRPPRRAQKADMRPFAGFIIAVNIEYSRGEYLHGGRFRGVSGSGGIP